MKPSPPRSRGCAPSTRTASYPTERPDTSGLPRKQARSRRSDAIQSRILARIAGAGIVRYSGLRNAELADLTATEILDNLWALVDARLVEPSAHSEIAVVDGVRQVAHYTLLSVARDGEVG